MQASINANKTANQFLKGKSFLQAKIKFFACVNLLFNNLELFATMAVQEQPSGQFVLLQMRCCLHTQLVPMYNSARSLYCGKDERKA